MTQFTASLHSQCQLFKPKGGLRYGGGGEGYHGQRPW